MDERLKFALELHTKRCGEVLLEFSHHVMIIRRKSNVVDDDALDDEVAIVCEIV